MATPADRWHTATGLGARWSNQQRGRGVYASCLWPTMQCWGFLEGSRDFKARSTAKRTPMKCKAAVVIQTSAGRCAAGPWIWANIVSPLFVMVH